MKMSQMCACVYTDCEEFDKWGHEMWAGMRAYLSPVSLY